MAASMTMAAEFPDVFQLFDSPKPKMTLAVDTKGIKDVKARDCVRAGSESTIQEKSTTAKRRRGTDPEPSGRKKQITSKDGGKIVLKDNDHTYSTDSVISQSSQASQSLSPLSLADIDDIFSSLGNQDDSHSSSLYLTKAAFGCTWGGSGRPCSHGQLCPFVRQYLGLSHLQEQQVNPARSEAITNNEENKENTERIVVVRQTEQGLVKVNDALQAGGGNDASSGGSWDSTPSYSLQLRPDQMQLLKNQNTRVTLATGKPGYSNQARQSYQAKNNRMEQLFKQNSTSSQQSFMRAVNASNSNVTVKRPSVSPTFVQSPTPSPTQMFPTPSPSPPTLGDQGLAKMMYPCAQCGTEFFDAKSLTKHTRNHHQPYTCTKPGCDEQVNYCVGKLKTF